MIEYAKFLLKRIFCRKSNIWIIMFSVMLLSGVLVMNLQSQDNLRKTFDAQIATNHREINKYQAKLDNETLHSDEQSLYQSQITFLKSNTEAYERLVDYYDAENWSLFYKSYIKVLEDLIDMIAPSDHSQINKDTNSMIGYYSEQIEYIKYLDQHNLEYEDKSFPIFGLTFTTYISKLISPVIILVSCVYILAQLFTMDYKKEVDVSKIFPIRKGNVFLAKMIVAISTSCFIYVSIIFCAFLIATIFTQNTGFISPIMIQDNISKGWNAVSSITFLKEWFFIGVLFYISTCLFTYVLSIFVKDDGALFLTTICIMLGVSCLPSGVDFLKSISQFLPTTYLNFVKVASGEIASEYSNINIDFVTGTIVLCLFIIFLFIFCWMIERFKKMKYL